MSEWQQVTLHEVCSFKRGLSYSGSDVQEESPSGIPFITIKNFHKGGGFNFSGFKKYLGRNYANFTVNPGELLIANTDVTRNADIIGSAIIAPEVGSDIAFSMDVTHLDVDKNKASPAFVFYRLLLDDAREHMKGASAGSTVLHLNLKQASAFSFKIPTKNEQKAIARVLDTLDTQIQKTEALIVKLEKVKEGLLHDLLTRGIDENGRLRSSPEQAPELYKESPLGLIPREWRIMPCGSLFSLSSGKAKTSASIKDESSGDVPVYGGNGINGYTNQRMVLEPTVVIGRVGENCGVVCLTKRSAWVTDNALYVKRLDGNVLIEFLYRYLEWWDLRKLQVATGQPLITQSVINKKPMTQPSLREQKGITKRALALEEYIKAERYKLKKLEMEKASLMDDLLTGRVRVTSLLEESQATTPA